MGEIAAEYRIPGGIGQENTALVEESFAGAALGGAAQLSDAILARNNVELDRLLKTGLGLDSVGSGRELAFNAARSQGGLHAAMDGAVAFRRGDIHPRMRARQDNGVGDIVRVIDKAAAGVAPDKGAIAREHKGLEIAEAERGYVPFVDSEDGLANLAQERLVHSHVARRRSGAVDEKTPGSHELTIYVFAVTDRNYQNEEFFVSDPAENAVITDAVTPYASEVAAKRLAESAWIARSGDPCIKIAKDLLLNLSV